MNDHLLPPLLRSRMQGGITFTLNLRHFSEPDLRVKTWVALPLSFDFILFFPYFNPAC
jgi:hypothetical protein